MKNSYVLHVDKLIGAYKHTFEEVEAYCGILLDNIDSNTREDVMSNILDTFYCAQNDNVEIEKIVGNDIIKFCEETCKLSGRYKFKHVFELFKNWSWILLVFEILTVISEIANTSFFDIRSNIGSFIISVSIALVLTEIYSIFSKKKLKRDIRKNKFNKKFQDISLLVFIVSVVIISLVVSNFELLVPTWIVLLISLIIIVVYRICYHKEIKEKKQEKSETEFSDMVAVETINQLKDKYKKINYKREKKNKEKLTEQKFLDMQIKKTNKGLKIFYVYKFIPIFCAIVCTIPVCLTSKVLDTIIFFIITFLVESAIFIPLSKSMSKLNKKLLVKFNYFKDNKIKLEEWK